jgi:uncharacterized repeat protein (TIGR01451 family)
MKNKIYTFKTYMLLVFLLTAATGFSQIILAPGNNTATCNLGAYGPVTILVPKEALTGDNIALNITLPGTLPANCTKSVKITRSSNLDFQSSGAIPFTVDSGNPLSYENNTPLAGNDGQNFNVFFKFPSYTTCNNTIGTFNVTVTTVCGGITTTCTTSVTIKARAANYWTISKQFYTGDLTCGTSKWQIIVTHNNPNGAGLGTYNLTGTITDTATVPIVSGASFTPSYPGTYNGSYYNQVILQNCGPNGSTITNTANYNFSLGGGCDTMTGTVSATSPPLANPNASISFVKSVSNPAYTNLTPGCKGYYVLSVCNNGNVPWTNLVITDNLNIPGISIYNISAPGWTISPTPPPYPPTTYTFTPTTPIVLNPGECKSIYIYFTIDITATVGSTIANTANLSYQAAGTGSSPGGPPPPSPCPSITCPTIDTAIQNTTSNVSFVVEAPKPIVNIKKCIINPPNALVPPIYQIGNNIEFSIMISNSGAGNLTTTVTDAIASFGQNLQLVSFSPPEYYDDEYFGNIYSCSPNFGSSTPIVPPFSVTPSGTSTLTWNIINMPGTCDVNKANFLVLKFIAKILPQLSGTKTNTATVALGPKSSAVNYSIDQVGILAVDKTADAEFVDNGGTFNYILTVSNNGSVPLDNIVVTDILPSCVVRNGAITVKNGIGTSLTNTATSNIIITLTPSIQIMPGESFVITIPVKKSGGGNCCNITVTATAKMTTTGVSLNANYGDTLAPAACVKSTECCDIEDFEATLNENNGSYSVTINGGSVPIQEVEISMVDYHVEYSNPDCKPDDLGMFGTLATTNTMLANLLLNAASNNTSNLNWLPGSPSILNTSVNLNIIDPLELNLECCDVTFSFCLKIRLKDANCNVCEKIVCFSSEQVSDKPCDIVLTDLPQGKKYCPGDSIPISWSGTTPSGLVNLFLFDNTNNTTFQVIATSLPATGTYNFTIPASIPCSPPRTWSFGIQDSDKLCNDRSNTFTIECCHQTDCACGSWKTDFVTIKGSTKVIPTDSQQKTMITLPTGGLGIQAGCGKELQLKANYSYSFTAPTYVCNPSDCAVIYNWEVKYLGNIVQSGVGKSFNYSFSSYGAYQVIFTPLCGGKPCDPCIITVIIDNIIHHDPDPIGLPYELPTKGDVYNPKTGETWMNKNLGATQVATSPTDAAAFGDLYQWGRLTDGHEKRTSSTTTTLSSSDVPGHGNFILHPNLPGPLTWNSPQNINLWQGVNGINNPCPSGYRIPTDGELAAERLSWATPDAAGAFASPLKWTLAGNRFYTNGQIVNAGLRGSYWSSLTNGAMSSYMYFNNGSSSPSNNYQTADGASVRCIKN